MNKSCALFLPTKATQTNPIKEAVVLLGGCATTGRLCGVSGKAVIKWCAKGRLPRTEWTGETDYATRISAALKGRVSKKRLLDAEVFAAEKERRADQKHLGGPRKLASIAAA